MINIKFKISNIKLEKKGKKCSSLGTLSASFCDLLFDKLKLNRNVKLINKNFSAIISLARYNFLSAPYKVLIFSHFKFCFNF